MSRRDELAERLSELEERLVQACAAAGRPRTAVRLVAVTKTWPVSDVMLLRDLGVRDVGENRDAEAAGKAAQVPDLCWHFVGSVQSNKARSVASYADVVHSVDRVRLVSALADGARRAGRSVEVFVQVSLDSDPNRAGVPPEGVPAVADAVATAQGLVLGGVMAVAPQDQDPARAFALLATVAGALQRDHPQARAVSAGMSGDLEPAVLAGATLVRVGTALLGPRPALLG